MASTFSKGSRFVTRNLRPRNLSAPSGVLSCRPAIASSSAAVVRTSPVISTIGPVTAVRFLTGSSDRKGITPDDKPKEDVSETPKKAITAANITETEFHKVADRFLDNLLAHLEQLQDERENVDVEFAVGFDQFLNLGPGLANLSLCRLESLPSVLAMRLART
jgi:hypothetical protein